MHSLKPLGTWVSTAVATNLTLAQRSSCFTDFIFGVKSFTMGRFAMTKAQEPTHLKSYQFLEQLKTLPFVEEITLFGSRARGDNTERADIDIAITCPNASNADWHKLMDLIDDADTLLQIDCVRIDTLQPNSPLLKGIQRDGIILYKKTS